MFRCCSLETSHPRLLPQSPKVCSIHLCLFFCIFKVSVYFLCLFILFMGFSHQECWNGLPFLSPVGHVLSELSTMTHLSWVLRQSVVHCFIRLCEPLHHDKAVIHEVVNSNTLATCCGKLTHWKRPWCWERVKARAEVGNRGWDS